MGFTCWLSSRAKSNRSASQRAGFRAGLADRFAPWWSRSRPRRHRPERDPHPHLPPHPFRRRPTVTFKRSGRYDEEALKQLNHFLRDCAHQEKTEMDRRLFDILWEVYRDVDGKQPINIISSYRSPATNAMLRRRSFGRRPSQPAHAGPCDGLLHSGRGPGRCSRRRPAPAARRRRFYPTSGSPFVHLDHRQHSATGRTCRLTSSPRSSRTAAPCISHQRSDEGL